MTHKTSRESTPPNAPQSDIRELRPRAASIPTARSWLWLCSLVALGALVVMTFRILLVLFAGILLALLLKAASAWLSRMLHLPYALALVLVLAVGLGSTALTIVLAAPTIGEQWTTLSRELPKAYEQVREQLERLPFMMSGGQQQPEHGQPHSGKGLDLAGMALSTVGGSLEALAGLVIAFFIGVYGAAQPAAYRRAALQLAPKAHRERLGTALDATASNLTRWLLGRLIAMLFVGISTTIVFFIFHVPLAFGLGALAGMLTFIEYAGAVISAIPPILLAFTQSPSTALAIGILFVVLHVVEGYVLTPLLARATVHLPPAITLASQAILGRLAGAMGLTLSTPLLIVAISCVKALRHDSEERAAQPH